MESTITELKKKISQIREYLLLWREVQSDISSAPAEEIKQLPESLHKILRNPDKKIFDYKLTILIIYGAFENYIESIISQYILNLNGAIELFSKLPEQMRSRHTELSAKLIGSVCAGYSKYDQMDNADIVRRLYSCYATPQNYQLNVHAFTQHSSNLRINTIRELFAGIGIPAIDMSISKRDEFTAYLQQANPEFNIISESQNNALYREKCFLLLDDLIERRNDIAHGVDDADDNILSADVLIEYADYILALSTAIYLIVLEEYAKTTIFSQGKNTIYLGNPIAVYRNCILCFNNNHNKVSVGDIIAGVNTRKKVRLGRIETLQIEGEPIDYVSPESSVDFGAKVDFHANRQYTYYIIK